MSKSEKGRPMKARSFLSSITVVAAIATIVGCGEAPENERDDGSSATSQQGSASTTGDDSEAAGVESQKKTKKKRKGHGRNGAADYQGAEKVKVPHESLKRGDACPECPKGKVYPVKEPAVLVRVTGMAPLCATVYELERLRCNLCGVIFTARSPEGVGTAKYDESAAAMVALLKYGTGMPFNRNRPAKCILTRPRRSANQVV